MFVIILLNKKYNYMYFLFLIIFNIFEFKVMFLYVRYVLNLFGFCFFLLYMIFVIIRRIVRSRNSNVFIIFLISVCDRKNLDFVKYKKIFLFLIFYL